MVYHVWIAAFRDTDGDGIGDLRGIMQSLDILRDLGVNALWLSPFFESASSLRNLHGYDVIDHYRVDPRFGTNDDADKLIREAHARGLRLIFDFVPNHLSTRHPWFIESRDPTSPKCDWFLWRDKPQPDPWTGFNDRVVEMGRHPAGRVVVGQLHKQSRPRRGKARFLETDAGLDLLAFWRVMDADRTLTLLSASSEFLPAVTVKLPPEVAGQPDAWVLGEGPVPLREGRNLPVGTLAPFASKVLRWGR